LKAISCFLAAAMALEPAWPQTGPATFSVTTNVVNVNVSITDSAGKPVLNLTKDDFLLYEDGKLQKLIGCDPQKIGGEVLPPAVTPALKERPQEKAAATPAKPAEPPPPVTERTLQDHRLIVMLFDLSSMQPSEQFRALDAAKKFLNTQMTSSDLVSIMVFGSSLKTLQDFTADRDLLISTIDKLHIGDSSELASLSTTGADPEDQSGLFVADETEFNIFNTDRKLVALQDAARQLGRYPQKKALVYISSGVEKTGVDNQSQMRATINTAVRSNVAFYPIDARGLVAFAPGGDATQAGAVGSNLYSGKGQRSLQDSFQNQQETLFTLADGTGGKALLDSNDLTLGMRQVQKDINSYYTLSYISTNKAEDGKYRRIQVKLAPHAGALKAKLDYRPGYFAPTTFARLSGADKEAQLQTAMESENPITDLPIAIEVDYFRIEKGKYFVPVSVKIPGSALAFQSKGKKSATELDFIAEVQDARGKVASTVRDAIPLKLDEAKAGEVVRKQLQYDTGFTLAPGKYTLRFVARENGEGKVGTFQAPFTIPDLGSGSMLRLSSVILSNQREPLTNQLAGVKNGKKILSENPLIDSSNQKLVPNVTRVFRPGQNLMVYLELYDPASPSSATPNLASVAASLALYADGKKVLETPAVRANRTDAKRYGTLPLHLQAQLKDLKPGDYICQVNVIDELGRKFAFPRSSLAVVAPPPAQPEQAAGTP
jgi:VWFA-related protein